MSAMSAKESIQKLPVDVLGMIVEKSDTSSLYNLKKTCKIFNQVTNDYLDRNPIVKMKTDVFTFELKKSNLFIKYL